MVPFHIPVHEDICMAGCSLKGADRPEDFSADSAKVGPVKAPDLPVEKIYLT
ncbi:hypothetical protein [Rothia nasimurium]|uniref:hypothetical protein n=1 Tax=Rothia nasimurium TaxID=85336 RepID=UPI001F1AFACA|nr:hypothetical protein [Rothia nasimurium]